MSGSQTYRVLTPKDGPPVEVINSNGQAPICLVCEHASATIPSALGDLGLAENHRYSHAVWDIGAADLACDLSERLDAPLVLGRFSRLAYDLNRPPSAPDAMTEQSGEIPVPGNRDLSETEKAARTAEIYEPFHAALSDLLDGFETPPVLMTVHSFTPIWKGQHRSTELGLLHDADASLAKAMLAQAEPGLRTELNAPYSAEDGVTHMLKRHAIPRGLPNVMIEVRNDLLTEAQDQSRISAMVARMLTACLAQEASSA